MSILPGWDSLGGVTRWESVFHLVGLTSLFLLVVFEALTWVYGNRKDVLRAAALASAADAAAERQQAKEHENKQKLETLDRDLHQAKSDATQAKADRDAAAKKLAELEKKTAPRLLTEAQKAIMAESLKKGPSGRLLIEVDTGSDDGWRYAENIAETLRASKWNVKLRSVTNFGTTKISGLTLRVIDVAHAPPCAGVLQHAFKDIGIDASGRAEPKLPPDEADVWLTVSYR